MSEVPLFREDFISKSSPVFYRPVSVLEKLIELISQSEEDVRTRQYYKNGKLVRVKIEFVPSKIEVRFQDSYPGQVVIRDPDKFTVWLEVGGKDFGIAFYLGETRHIVTFGKFTNYETVAGWGFNVEFKKGKVIMDFATLDYDFSTEEESE